MYDNKIKHNEKRTVHTYDVEGGEMLLIAYFPAADVFTINGIAVTRAQSYDDMDGLTVFVRRPDKKVFTVVTSSLAKLYI
jgi:uncharacterized protein YkuJ